MNAETEHEAGTQHTPPEAESPGAGSQRVLRDAPSLQALAHPTRLALLEAIGLAGTMTATQASRVVGESPTACAYHLRMLARLGFIEEAGGGHGRERPWRLVPTGFAFDETPDDPALAKATAALSKALLERFVSTIRRFELTRFRYPQDVQDVTGTIQSIVFATPEELGQLRAELIALLSRYLDRLDPARRPQDSYPFEIVAFTHVLDVPSPGAPDAQPPPHPQRTDLPGDGEPDSPAPVRAAPGPGQLALQATSPLPGAVTDDTVRLHPVRHCAGPAEADPAGLGDVVAAALRGLIGGLTFP